MSLNEVKSPIKKIPSCWEDEKRMTVLYAPFRARDINPVDYDYKMKFWQNVIIDWCMERNECVLTIKKLQEEFKRKERIPLGLSTVMENLERNGHLKLKEEFMNIDPEETWTVWAVKSLVKTPVVWSFSKLKMALIEIDEKIIEYICLEFLKKKSEELLLKADKSQKLYNQTDIKDMLTSADGVEISQGSFDILLRWLQINKVIQTKRIDNDFLIKFSQNKSNQISDIDLSLYILEKNKLSFEKAIQALEVEKEELISTAKNYLKKGMRDTAKTYLRRKKEVEKTIAKRVSALENMEILVSRIHDSSSDSQVLDTYKIALNALKASFKEHGLSEDEVIKTVTDIQEINEMHEEIQNALAEPVSAMYDTELDDELQAIIESDKREQIKVSDVVLPDAPSHSPSKITEKKAHHQEAAL